MLAMCTYTLYEELAATGPYLWVVLAETQARLGRHAEARANFTMALRADVAGAGAVFAEYLKDVGGLPAVEELYEELASKDPYFREALAKAQARLGKHAEARTNFEKAIAEGAPGAATTFSQYLRDIHGLPAVEALYERLAPRDPYLWVELAEAQARVGEHAKARKNFTRAIDSRAPGAASAFGLYLKDIGGLAAVEVLYERLAPADPYYRLALAEAQAAVGKGDAARANFEEAVTRGVAGAATSYGLYLANTGDVAALRELSERVRRDMGEGETPDLGRPSLAD